MKKLILFFVAVLFAVNVSAERGSMVVSGIVHFHSHSEIIGSESGPFHFTPGFNSFTIAPSLQHFITDRFAFGFQLGFITSKYDDFEIQNISAEFDRLNIFSFDLFGRYYLLRTQRFGVFGQASVGAGFGNEATENMILVGAGIVPGIQFFINNRWSVETQLAPIVSFISMSADHLDKRVNELNVGINGVAPILFGFNFHF